MEIIFFFGDVQINVSDDNQRPQMDRTKSNRSQTFDSPLQIII